MYYVLQPEIKHFMKLEQKYLRISKKHNSSNRTRRVNDHGLLSISPISKMCANSYFGRSFSYAFPFLWNPLDMSTCIRILDFDHFKGIIKTELYLSFSLLALTTFIDLQV